ncbi:MAG: ribonuclease H, partial [Candidatus Manganitrophaceae bacterium]
MTKLSIYTDGASRNNPGEASIGVVIKNERGETIQTLSE